MYFISFDQYILYSWVKMAKVILMHSYAHLVLNKYCTPYKFRSFSFVIKVVAHFYRFFVYFLYCSFYTKS